MRQPILAVALLLPLGLSCLPQARPQYPPPRPPAADTTQEPNAETAANPAAKPEVTPPVARTPDRAPEDPRAAELYGQALQAVESGRHDEALQLWEEVWELAPGFRDVGRLLTNEYLVRGLERYARADLDAAIRLWEDALEIDPRNPRARGYLDNVRPKRERLQEVMTESASESTP